jgi:hypothetical protein
MKCREVCFPNRIVESPLGIELPYIVVHPGAAFMAFRIMDFFTLFRMNGDASVCKVMALYTIILTKHLFKSQLKETILPPSSEHLPHQASESVLLTGVIQPRTFASNALKLI